MIRDRKITAMYKEYGRNFRNRCSDCCNFRLYNHCDKPRRKCIAYGDSCSDATDWLASFEACGLFDKPFDEERMRPLIDVLRRGGRKAVEVDENQVSLF